MRAVIARQDKVDKDKCTRACTWCGTARCVRRCCSAAGTPLAWHKDHEKEDGSDALCSSHLCAHCPKYQNFIQRSTPGKFHLIELFTPICEKHRKVPDGDYKHLLFSEQQIILQHIFQSSTEEEKAFINENRITFLAFLISYRLITPHIFPTIGRERRPDPKQAIDIKESESKFGVGATMLKHAISKDPSPPQMGSMLGTEPRPNPRAGLSTSGENTPRDQDKRTTPQISDVPEEAAKPVKFVASTELSPMDADTAASPEVATKAMPRSLTNSIVQQPERQEASSASASTDNAAKRTNDDPNTAKPTKTNLPTATPAESPGPKGQEDEPTDQPTKASEAPKAPKKDADPLEGKDPLPDVPPPPTQPKHYVRPLKAIPIAFTVATTRQTAYNKRYHAEMKVTGLGLYRKSSKCID